MDIAILRELNPTGPRRPPIRSIARRLGLDEKTVRTRIRKLEETFLKGERYAPNVRLFQRRMAAYLLRFDDPVEKAKARERVRLLEGVTALHEGIRSLKVEILYRLDDDLRRRLRLLEELAAVPPQKLYDHPTPEVKMQPSRLDWQIVSVLRAHPAWSPQEVGEELGVTARTVRNRLDRMVRKGALFRVPLMDVRDVENLTMYALICFFEEGEERRALAAFQDAMADKALCHLVASGSVVEAGVAAVAQREPEETYRQVASLEGVAEAYLDFPRRYHDCSQVIDQLIDEELARLETA